VSELDEERGVYPTRLGPYAVTGPLARGGMSTVLGGTDADGRRVAIKLADQLDRRSRERFRREIEACRRLAHRGIIQIRAVGEHDGRPWYAMDYHGEVTLLELIACNGPGVANELPALIGAINKRAITARPLEQRRRLPRSAALSLLTSIVDAVAHAHSRGLVHRDLKPENILLRPDGRPVVADFGLVVELDERRRLTRTNQLVGTVGYLAPEQLDGRRGIDERVDIYALGMILRELLTGLPPGPEHNQAAALNALERPLRVVVQRATHPSPARRYHSAQAFLADLQHVQRGEPIVARPDPPWVALWYWLGRHHRIAAMLLLAVLLLAGLAASRWVLYRIEQSTWGQTLADLSLSEISDLRRLQSLSGNWRIGAAGLEPAIDAVGEKEEELKKLALYRAGVLAMGLKEIEQADRHLSALAGLDFSYRDVAERLDKLSKIRDKE